MTLYRVTGIRVRWVADLGLVGYEEAQAVAFAVSGAIGSLLGVWVAVQLRAVLG